MAERITPQQVIDSVVKNKLTITDTAYVKDKCVCGIGAIYYTRAKNSKDPNKAAWQQAELHYGADYCSGFTIGFLGRNDDMPEDYSIGRNREGFQDGSAVRREVNKL